MFSASASLSENSGYPESDYAFLKDGKVNSRQIEENQEMSNLWWTKKEFDPITFKFPTWIADDGQTSRLVSEEQRGAKEASGDKH